MVRAAVISFVLQRLALLRAQRAKHRFRRQRQFHEAHADRVVDGIGDRRRDAEGRDLAHALGAERAVRLVASTYSFSIAAGTSWMPGIL